MKLPEEEQARIRKVFYNQRAIPFRPDPRQGGQFTIARELCCRVSAAADDEKH